MATTNTAIHEQGQHTTREPLFVLVGRVVPIKDVMGFVRAARLVADQDPRARFAVVGPLDHDPQYADRCRQAASDLRLADRFAFVGQADPCPWVRRASAVVLTSVSEAQPLALLEAMATGTPVVAPRVGGGVELVDLGPGAAGLLTTAGDVASTAGALLRLAVGHELAARLAAGGRRRVARHHRPGTVATAYGRIHDRVSSEAWG